MRQNRFTLIVVALMTLGLASFAAAQMMGHSQSHSAVMNKADSSSQPATMGRGGMGMMGQSSQMMNGANGQMPMGQNDSMSQNATMKMFGRMETLMGDMSQRYTMMSGDFDKLETHFQQMMKMQDMTALKEEMQKHYAMMQKMREGMNRQEGMFQNMMAMMQADGMQMMHGMKDSKPMGSVSSDQHPENP